MDSLSLISISGEPKRRVPLIQTGTGIGNVNPAVNLQQFTLPNRKVKA
jgi:hypothetical protein